jgi:hypothetical protein
MKHLLFLSLSFIFLSLSVVFGASLSDPVSMEADVGYDLEMDILYANQEIGLAIVKLTGFHFSKGFAIVLINDKIKEATVLYETFDETMMEPLESSGPLTTGCDPKWTGGGFCLWHTYYCWVYYTWPCCNTWPIACGCC